MNIGKFLFSSVVITVGCVLIFPLVSTNKMPIQKLSKIILAILYHSWSNFVCAESYLTKTSVLWQAPFIVFMPKIFLMQKPKTQFSPNWQIEFSNGKHMSVSTLSLSTALCLVQQLSTSNLQPGSRACAQGTMEGSRAALCLEFVPTD